MKRLFLASSVFRIVESMERRIKPKGLKLLFITTASEVEEGDLWWLRKDREALIDIGFKITDYTLTNKSAIDIKRAIENSDAIFFSGGNSFYLLGKIIESKSGNIIKKFVEQGKIYIGSSAGSIIAGPNIFPIRDLDNINKAPKLKNYESLNLVDFIIFPHWGSEKFKERYLGQRMENSYNADNKIILLTDNQYVDVENDKYEIVDIRK